MGKKIVEEVYEVCKECSCYKTMFYTDAWNRVILVDKCISKEPCKRRQMWDWIRGRFWRVN